MEMVINLELSEAAQFKHESFEQKSHFPTAYMWINLTLLKGKLQNENLLTIGDKLSLFFYNGGLCFPLFTFWLQGLSFPKTLIDFTRKP